VGVWGCDNSATVFKGWAHPVAMGWAHPVAFLQLRQLIWDIIRFILTHNMWGMRELHTFNTCKQGALLRLVHV